ncbi:MULTISPECIES: penicillin-binding transpeptidase domain-containing protein [Streptomyces]|uniref:Penicillin-binding transpeptidase domain-containing protein n=1 Tax=Streptomyces glycanivorans TaxID=3033808 RepID=A0ABY9J4M4_9ACTN|nr:MULTISPECIES: penicillin-binding transpeptidase domain-containing protein [unclassified Streptomyces]WSQ76123.1 penicillin-binding transpeptidase domain-containing protein [Streptomyces sp. NBC_01213]TXS20183.1 PbsX family transcriptional regulator [Streptomyces sp. wa22]WLQ62612.1 penicillin-binding transpeptidase domain-containing protein [Streptomyces sp. Alt3]WSR10599.1 penicillin-binding transpeptidase domain-containing protein [Streptomyces sp. NBC_01208]WSR46704.1 penicillin-binding 
MSDPTLQQMARHDRGGRRGRSTGPVLGVAVAVVLAAGAGWWGYRAWSEDTPEKDPEVVAATARLQSFLDAWAAGEATEAGALSDSPKTAESLLTSVMTNLKPTATELSAGDGEKNDKGEVTVPYTARFTVPAVGVFGYESEATLVRKAEQWIVEFSSPMVHPRLEPGKTLALKAVAKRASVLDTNGDDLQAASLRGSVDEQGKGTFGLEARYDKQLRGGGGAATSEVVIADRQSGEAEASLTRSGAKSGEPVRTTIDPKVQGAAAAAMEGLKVNAALIALEPSTGNILAVSSRPAGGLNRAMAGQYPPGSTFKVVTAAAMLKAGVKPSDVVACPKFAHVDGQRFENQNQFTLPAGSTFKDSFAKSCNTMFVENRAKAGGSALHDTAEAFGIGGVWDVGDTTYDGSVPVSTSDNDLAASTIGQARVQASPLVMASIAATVKEGTFRQPVLVPDAVKKKHEATARLDPSVTGALRDMMRATVTYGAGSALTGLPGEPHAKTGTAEFGQEKPPRTHAWMIGYQGADDLAWCVMLEDGGSGGADAGPVAARFLENLT